MLKNTLRFSLGLCIFINANVSYASSCLSAGLASYLGTSFSCSLGPVQFSNFQSSDPSNFTVAPNIQLNGSGGPSFVTLAFSGEYFLSSVGLTQPKSISFSVSYDYQVAQGSQIDNTLFLGTAFDNGPDLSENIFLNSPCSAIVTGPNSFGSGCAVLGTAKNSGSVAISGTIRALPPMGNFGDQGRIGDPSVRLSLSSSAPSIPEPSTSAMLVLGLFALGASVPASLRSRAASKLR